LKAGTYSLAVGFKDGTSAVAQFIVAEGKAPAKTDDLTNNISENQDAKEQNTEDPEAKNPGAEAAIPFVDVKDSDWFVSGVMFAYNNSLMTGTSTSPMMFSPNSPLTRGMVVTVLYRHAGSPEIEPMYAEHMMDVPHGAWYEDAMGWAVKNGIIAGYGEGLFGPEDNITREQLTTILNNYAGFAEMDIRETRQAVAFDDDADISGYAKESIGRLFRAGIINGKPGNLFDPKGNATRAEFAAMLQRFIEAA
jgi:hypothetical protein